MLCIGELRVQNGLEVSLAQARMIKNFKEQVERVFAQRGNSGIVEIKNYIKAEFICCFFGRGDPGL